jgi:hypothetical protein
VRALLLAPFVIGFALAASPRAQDLSTSRIYIVSMHTLDIEARIGAAQPLLVTGTSGGDVQRILEANYAAWRKEANATEREERAARKFNATFVVGSECVGPGWAAVINYRYSSAIGRRSRWYAVCGQPTPAEAIRKAEQSCVERADGRCDREDTSEALYIDLAAAGPPTLTAATPVCWNCDPADIAPFTSTWMKNRLSTRGRRPTTTHSIAESLAALGKPTVWSQAPI